MGRLTKLLVIFAFCLGIGIANANAEVKRAGTQIPEEAIELKADIAKIFAELAELIESHDLLIIDHNEVLDLLNSLNEGGWFAHLVDDALATALCGAPIYGEDEELTFEEQAAVSEWLVECYQSYCSGIEQTEAEIQYANQLLWEAEAELNNIILAAPSPTPISSPTPGVGAAGLPGYPASPVPAISPTPIPSPYPTPGWNGKL